MPGEDGRNGVEFVRTPGRKKKYTGRTLRKAVERYFRGITRTVTLREQVNTGEKDSWGHWVYELRDITNDAGEPVKVREFVVPPTVGGLCEALGIHRSTWADYCDRDKHPELAETTAWAREVIQHYLESELLGRDGRNLKGVIFSLQNNFGYSEKREVELGTRAAKAVAAAAVPMDEKKAMLEELAREFAGDMARSGDRTPLEEPEEGADGSGET